ncbi:hypothetical protein [Microbacterium jejuense]|uniref:hypothetical protein n=1 Tax=Microbacterium jejuense TaxID=1263637 RepID=UPI0031EBECD9
MFASPTRIVAHGVECVNAGGSRWRYTSLAPWPQLGPDGTPLVSLLRAGSVAMVQLGVQLDPPGAVLERARAAVEAAVAASITLDSGLDGVDRVDVVLDAGPGERIVATSAGSGYPPYTAVFSFRPEGADLDAVAAALGGESGRVEIRYRARRDGGEVRISADLAEWMPRPASVPRHDAAPSGA